ncbi:exosortase A [Kordiimonas sp.]|uniref:exosortase A n=1 Tax=Kordiimonas sp. TaxID=1970157 RepID=UPI003A948052
MSAAYRVHLVFLACVATVIWAWWGTVGHLTTILWRVDIFSHGLLVPFVSGWLIWRNRILPDKQQPKPAFIGALLVALVSACWLLGTAMDAAVVQHGALIAMFHAIYIMVYGTTSYRHNIFPLFFLFFAVPFSGGLVGVLQQITTVLSVWGLELFGIPHEVDGVLIQLSNGLYEIAEACAGLQFFFSSVVTGVLLAYLAFESWWRRFGMIAAALVVPVLANAGRVFTTLLIAEATDQDFAKSIDHIVYGWVFLSFVLLILIGVAYRFSDKEEPEVAVNGSWGASHWKPAWWLLAALIPLLASLWASRGVSPVEVCNVTPLPVPSCESCVYRHINSFSGRAPFELNGTDASLTALYRRGAALVSVHAALFAPDREGHRAVQPAYRTLQDGWFVLAGAPTAAQLFSGHVFSETVIRRGNAKQLTWRLYFAAGEYRDSARATKIALAKARLLGQPASASTLVLATGMSGGIEEARAELQNFLSTIPADSFLWGQLTEPEDKAECAE